MSLTSSELISSNNETFSHDIDRANDHPLGPPPPPLSQLFDPSSLEDEIQCPAIETSKPHIQILIQHFRKFLFSSNDCINIPWLIHLDNTPLDQSLEPDLKRIKSNGNDPSPSPSLGKSIILLNPTLDVEHKLEDTDLALLASCEATITQHRLHITFQQRPTCWILHQLLPHLSQITQHFEIVGHLLHLNLREQELKDKYIIGRVILEKNKSLGIRTVVNKVGMVEDEYRVLPMELLAGDPDTIVQVAQGRCLFKFDFSKVFWNSRLQGEHTRIVQLISPNQRVCDMFAGIGPFAIPLTKKNVTVYANDLNPSSFDWMISNANKNLSKQKRSYLHCYCMDGRAFCRKVIQEDEIQFDHILMNLPKLAPEFCNVFVNLFPPTHSLPRVHVYCFSSATTQDIMVEKALARIEEAMQTVLDKTKVDIFKIRQTSTNTFEYCLSFVLPLIAYQKP